MSIDQGYGDHLWTIIGVQRHQALLERTVAVLCCLEQHEHLGLIADVTATGTTLRENRLKTLMDGTILTSQSCLIVNRRALAGAKTKLSQIKAVLERAEGYLRAQDYCAIAANVQGSSQDAVAARVLDQPELAGIKGPTIAQVYSAEGGDWYSVTVLVGKARVLDAVEHMREFGGSGITVTQPSYLFFDKCQAYERLTAAVAGVN